jgi:hypothetical protein
MRSTNTGWCFEAHEREVIEDNRSDDRRRHAPDALVSKQ